MSESRDAVVNMACVESSEVTDRLEQGLTLEAGGDMVGYKVILNRGEDEKPEEIFILLLLN